MTQLTILAQSLNIFAADLVERVKQSTSFEVASINRIFTIQDLYNRAFYEDTDITYPFMSYQLKTTSLAIDKLGSIISHKQKLPLSKVTIQPFPLTNQIEYRTDVTGKRIKRTNVLPITSTLSIFFVTNTPAQFDEFVSLWLQLYPNITLRLKRTDQLDYPITFVPDVENITYPEKETDNNGDHYKGELVGTLSTFVGDIDDVPLIQDVSSAQEIVETIQPITQPSASPVSSNLPSSAIKLSF